jgi:hypothetical protein
MPIYQAHCDSCKRTIEYYRNVFEPEPRPDCDACGGPTRWKPSLVSVPKEWTAYYDHGLGVNVERMADIEKRRKELATPTPYRDTMTGEMMEIPGARFDNPGRIHGA